MSALKPDTATSKPVKEEDNTTAPAKKKKKNWMMFLVNFFHAQ